MADGANTIWRRVTGGDRWKTVPNAITAVRLALLPVVMASLAQHWFAAASGLAVIVFLSDFADGFVARRFDQASALGRWLDPVADRATVVALSIGMACGGILPLGLLVLAVLPDALLGLVAVMFFRGTPAIPVSAWGKARTALQFTAFLLLLLAAVLAQAGVPSLLLARTGLIAFGAAVVASFVAGMFYSAVAARRLIGAETGEAS